MEGVEGVHTTIPMGTKSTCDISGGVLKHHPLSGFAHGHQNEKKSLTTCFIFASRDTGGEMRRNITRVLTLVKNLSRILHEQFKIHS